MSKIKHAATSWTIKKPELSDPDRENYEQGIITIRMGTLDDYSTTCTIYPCGLGFKLSMRQAKLIAAAPELLGLIQWITRVTNNPEIGIKCDAAIKKATT